MRAPPDAGARAEALDVGRSFIVRAPAGSGKTGLLTQRYLALLAVVAEPEEIVAITFTIKAATQMRHRVLDALRDAVLDAPLGGDFDRVTRRLARRALERDRERGWHVVSQPSRLRIQTIDSLCMTLVRQMPYLAGFGGELHPVEDATPYYREVVRELLGALGDPTLEWSRDLAVVLAHLDNDIARFESMVSEMLAKRDQWMRHVYGPRVAPAELRARVQRNSTWALARVLGALREEMPEALRPLLEGRLPRRHALEQGMALAVMLERHAEHLYAWKALAEGLLTKDGKPKVTSFGYFGPEEGCSRVGDGGPAALADHPEFTRRLHQIRAWPHGVYTDEEWRVLESVLRVLRAAAGLSRVVFSAHGNIDFIELGMAARAALGEPGAPSDLALTLDYRIQHVLVDEFQDTSHAQIDLLSRLTAGWEADDGRTFFLVGDPMQSIYRFREADVGLFLRVRDQVIGETRIVPLVLTSNFRSTENLVEWINEHLPCILPDADDAETGAVAFSPSNPARARSGGEGVNVHPLVGGSTIRQAQLITELIEAEQRRGPPQSIAILVRARTHLAPILRALRRRGIPYRGIDIEPLSRAPVVQDLLALTRALLYPADRVAWLALLRAPWSGLRLQDLERLVQGTPHRLVLEALADDARLGSLSDDGRPRAERMKRLLERILAERGLDRLSVWVERAWRRLEGDRIAAESELEDAGKYFMLLDSLEAEANGLDLRRLQEKVATHYSASGVASAGVEVMTIHNAKGLEFDTVIIPSLEGTTLPQAKRMLEWSEQVDGATGAFNLLLAPIPGRAETGGIYEHLRQIESVRIENETARLLYVALTRACERLHLIASIGLTDRGALRKPRSGSLLARLWPLFEPVARAALAGTTARRETNLPIEERPACIRRVTSAHVQRSIAMIDSTREGPSVLGDMVEFAWAGSAAKHVGNLVHRLARVVSVEGTREWDEERIRARRAAWGRALRASGVAGAEIDGSVGQVETALRNMLCDDRGRWILRRDHRDARSEHALSGFLRGDLVDVVLDRTFIDEEGTRWIIDYKTGRHEGGDVDEFLDREQARYRGQLEAYASLMAQMDERPIRLGLYFPMLCGWREWVWPERSRP